MVLCCGEGSSTAISACRSKLFRIGATVWRPCKALSYQQILLCFVVLLYICLLTVSSNDIFRNTAQGTGSTAARIGGVLAPYIALMVSVCCSYSVTDVRCRGLKNETTVQYSQCILTDSYFTSKKYYAHFIQRSSF